MRAVDVDVQPISELIAMPPDTNSRTILRVCGAAFLLLATWLHGNGKGFERGKSRCEALDISAEQARRCAPCRSQDLASPSVRSDDTTS